jgi:hypothetical protein
MRRNQPFWGVILLLLGGLLLADSMGVRLPNETRFINLFWPALLLLTGAWILFGIFFRGAIETEQASIDLEGASSANLKINHGAGEIKLHSGGSASELLHGSFDGGLDKKVNRNGDRLEVRMRPAKDVLDFPFWGPQSQINWDVALNPNIAIDLNLNLGANKSVIDLQDLNVTNIDLDTGASDSTITLPSRGRFRADFDLGAASLVVIIPAGVSARILAQVAAGDIHVDRQRFPSSGKYFQSPDFETAANAVDMTMDAGAASIKIK